MVIQELQVHEGSNERFTAVLKSVMLSLYFTCSGRVFQIRAPWSPLLARLAFLSVRGQSLGLKQGRIYSSLYEQPCAWPASETELAFALNSFVAGWVALQFQSFGTL